MTTTNSSTTRLSDNHIHALIISSLFITMMLFFIDEGYYDFRWMADLGNWVAFLLYFAAFLICQIIVSVLFFRNQPVMTRTIMSILTGGILFALLIILYAIFML